MAYEPPLLRHMKPFLLGVGVLFKLLNDCLHAGFVTSENTASWCKPKANLRKIEVWGGKAGQKAADRVYVCMCVGVSLFRKILVSVKFVSAILGPEMAAPILWAPGKMRSFCRKTSMSIKFLVLGGGG